MVPEDTLAKRITRAKHKIVASGVPYRVPSPRDLGSRLDEVLTVIYLVFNEGYVTTAGVAPIRRDLARDAEWLASLLCHLLPQAPEALGLLSLIRLHLARWSARLDAAGRIVLLQHQDRALWDRRAIAQAVELIERAAAFRQPGRYLIEAMIAAVHCEAQNWNATDWTQVLALYTLLVEIDDSPVVALNRAIAQRYVEGPAAALTTVNALAEQLEGYHLFHAARAALLRDLGQPVEAAREDTAALALTRNSGERALLEDRLSRPRLD
jgi:RNA polymerase sigma-70 factor (ECF subfamily)